MPMTTTVGGELLALFQVLASESIVSLQKNRFAVGEAAQVPTLMDG